jgi:nucleoid DNA-binding protein
MEEKSVSPASKPMNKTEVIAALCEATELTKQQVAGLLDQLAALMGKNLRDGGPGVFTLPGLMQIKVVRKPATPERKGINPFTKEETVFKAKPAKTVVKVVPLKGLKDMVQPGAD